MTTDNTEQSELLALFEPFDDEWKSATRSIRIDGTVTSVRLENFYWRVVAEIAAQEGLQVPQVMTQLSKAAKTGETKHTNFTSFVRVCCGRYLDRRDNAMDAGEEGAATARLEIVATNGQGKGAQDAAEQVSDSTAESVTSSVAATEDEAVQSETGLRET